MSATRKRFAIIALAAATMMWIGGCGALKKVASGGKLTSADLVREGDRAVKAKQRENKQVSRLEGQVNTNLKQIAELRQKGRFSSAEYREKSLNRTLKKLRSLDSSNAVAKAAPGKLADIKSTYSKSVYQRKATAERCDKIAANTKDARMNERWSRVSRNIDSYVKCRRKMKDVGVDEGKIGPIDAKMVDELDAFAEYSLKESKANRIASKFRYAVAYERDMENKMGRYGEIAPDSRKPTGYLKKMNKIRMKHRDPQEIAAEKAKGAYEAWKKLATEQFHKEWDAIHAAEAKAKADFDKGFAAIDKGDYNNGLKALYKARETLFAGAWPNALAFDTALASGALRTGLSYEISAAIARAHFDQGDKAKLYPELAIIKTGRKWLSKEDETTVRLYNILADRKGKLTPKTTDQVRRYASRYAKETRAWRTVKDTAKASSGEAYSLLGVDLQTISHRRAASKPTENAGKIVWVKEPVTSVSGRNLRFDFRRSYKVPTKCWNTRKISHVNLWTGRVYYQQKCKYKTVRDGYYLVVAGPPGVRVKKGDQVSFYAAVGAKKGNDLRLVDAGYVRVAPKGKTRWYTGAKIGR